MEKRAIDVAALALQPFTVYGSEGALLVCGEGPALANPMTISWGTFGIIWGRPIAMVLVRPTRHTFTFINRMPDFTINWLPDDWGDALKLCGSQSGRDLNKFTATGLTPTASCAVTSPSIAESVLTLECRTVYRDEIDPTLFMDPAIEGMYPSKDYHTLFFGEVVAAFGGEPFCG